MYSFLKKFNYIMELSEHHCFLCETKTSPQHKYKLRMILEDC